ncbi:MAG: septal ring lytic transglycosylase RlpA family protein [Candidatus Magnetominusculus sp. LBB02]|nr:septal ring lytic transglycosylase RlpA family protein [Candidatus Magnetominusculus sp. LBB02]
MREVCYIQDPKTGRFLGSKPGCSHGSGELSEKLLEKVEKDKAAIKRRVEAAAADGKLEPRDSELKDKAEELGRDVNSGAMTSGEGLNELSKGRSYPLYAKAVNLIEQDLPFWSGIADKAGTDEVDTLMAGIIGAPVPGSFIFVKNTANEDAGVQKVSDNEPPKIPSGATKEQIDATHEKWTRINVERQDPKDKDTLVKRGTFDEQRHTKCHGNECDTQASVYAASLHDSPTASGPNYDMYGYSAAMQPLYVGDIHKGKFVYAKVTNNDTKPPRSVIVKVNDVGPFPVGDKDGKHAHEDATRAIDLSGAAYAKIAGDNMGKGVLNVTVKFLKPEEAEHDYNEQKRWASEHRPELVKQVDAAMRAIKGKRAKGPKNQRPKPPHRKSK